MNISRSTLMSRVKNAVTEEELRESVVYIIPSIEQGEEINMNRKIFQAQVPSILLFIDMEPMANWSHRCKYMLLNKDGEIISTEEGQFPPGDKNLKIFYKPENIEPWMLLTDKLYRE